MEIDRQTFDQQRSRRFGNANPQRIRLAFWVKMAQERSEPYRYRKEFGVKAGEPIWTSQRMGQTETKLADGRTICIGGEYDDFYDPDFCIYNDVVVRYPDGSVKIYGYPREVFPPTDFHTASLVSGRIVIIGCLGYHEDFYSGFTPVQSLDLWNFRIEPIPTHGDPPGWIHDHEAEVDPSGESITIRGGKILVERPEGCVTRLNLEEYRLHLADGRWDRITDRLGWRQYQIHRVDRNILVVPKKPSKGEPFPRVGVSDGVFYPTDIPHQSIPREDFLSDHLIVVEGVTIRFQDGPLMVTMVVEGNLPEDVAGQVAESIRANIEADIGQPCVFREI